MGRSGEPFNDDDADGFLLGEVAVYVYDSHWQQTSFVAERGPGAVVNVYCSVWGEPMQNPEVAVADRVGDREEAGV